MKALRGLSRRRLWTVVALLGVLWVIGAVGVVPALIRAVHAGRIGFLAPLLAGRETTPVGNYLDDWARLARALSFVLTTVIVILASVQVIFFSDSRSEAEPAHRDPTWREVLLVALWFGLVTGLGEAYYAAGKMYLALETVPGFREAGPNTLWMAPVGDALLFVAVGLIYFPIARILGGRSVRPGSRERWLTGGLAFLGLLVLLMMTARLYLWSAAILAAAAAIRVAGARSLKLELRGNALPRRVARLALVPALIGVAVGVTATVRERAGLRAMMPGGAARPNVLLLVLDTQQASNLSLYGYQRNTSPSLDRLASQGVAFNQAIAPAPWTLPSHAVMFTGRHNNELDIEWFKGLDGRFLTLAEALRDQGYRAGGFAANMLFCNRFHGLDQGFMRFRDEAISPAWLVMNTWLGRSPLVRLRKLFGDYQYFGRRRASTINREFLAWLEESPADRPFFAFLNYFDVHEPYLPPSPYDQLYAAPTAQYWIKGVHSDGYTPGQIQQLHDRYDGGTAYADTEVGALMDSLRGRNLLDNTIVILVSDHGEEFGEHGWLGHGHNLYLPALRVPLIIRYPGVVPTGLRIDAPVTLRDIPATVLDLVGLGSDRLFPGASLARHWREGQQEIQDTALSEYMSDKSLVIGNHHFIQYARGEVALYDLQDDPAEAVDLAPGSPGMVQAFQTALKRTLALPPDSTTAISASMAAARRPAP